MASALEALIAVGGRLALWVVFSAKIPDDVAPMPEELYSLMELGTFTDEGILRRGRVARRLRIHLDMRPPRALPADDSIETGCC